MEDEEEEIWFQKCRGGAAAVILFVMALLKYINKQPNHIGREPSVRRDLDRNAHMLRILNGSSFSCLDYLRMRRSVFFNLAQLMRDGGLLKDTINVPIEEQLAMFLHIVGHKSKNRVMRIEFIRSGETISRYFNKVLRAICQLRDQYMKQAPNATPPEVLNNPMYYPYFTDCIGMIDGTHIDAMLPPNLIAQFRGRKGVTQNVLAAVTPNKCFTYVMAGWEGSANDFTVLKDALSLPPPSGLRLYDGKYYLCDAGYATMPGFISPYRGVMYHLKEYAGRTPNNRRELFNLRHSSLRSKIEATFGILKERFKILSAKPHHPFPTQVDIVLACTVLHNYIAITDPHDKFFNETIEMTEELGEIVDEDNDDIVEYGLGGPQHEQAARKMWKEYRDQIAWDMWVDYCSIHRMGNTTESGMSQGEGDSSGKKLSFTNIQGSGAHSTNVPTVSFGYNALSHYLYPSMHRPPPSSIIGDDLAPGSLRMIMYQQFGASPMDEGFSEISPTSSHHVVNVDSQAPKLGLFSPQSVGNTKGFRSEDQLRSTARSKRRKGNKGFDDEFMASVMEKIREVAMAIQESKPTYWTKELSTCVYSHREYPEIALYKVIETLIENETAGRIFIAKTSSGQKIWLNEYMQTHGYANGSARMERHAANEDTGSDIDDDFVEL